MPLIFLVLWWLQVLEPRNALESVFSWQCGRPSLHEPGEWAAEVAVQHRSAVLVAI